MRVLVTGATGLRGRAIMKAFADAELTGVALSRARAGLVRLDLRQTAEIEALVERLQPEIIVHSAAERRPDVCEKDPEGTRALNVEATAALARSAAACGAWILYTSTDYVFDGTNPPYAGTSACPTISSSAIRTPAPARRDRRTASSTARSSREWG